MRGRYLPLLARSSVRRLTIAIASAWLSFGTVGLLLLLSVRLESGSYRAASFAVAAFSVGSGLLAPVRGRLVDRYGPAALMFFALGYSAGLLGVRVSERTSAPIWVADVCAGFAGASAPPLIAFLRKRWSEVVEPEVVRAGYAITSMIGDGALVGGPVVAAALVYWSQDVAFAICIAPVVWSGLYARHAASPAAGTARVLSAPETRGDPERRISWTLFAPVVLVSVGIGGVFGTSEVAVPIASAHSGHAHLAGLLLAAFGLGSIGGAAVAGHSVAPPNTQRRFLLSSAGLGVGVAALALAPSLVVLALLLTAAGACLGPANVFLYELVDVVVPLTRATEAMTWITTAQAAGTAIGSILTGLLATSIGVRWAFAISGLFLGCLACLVLITKVDNRSDHWQSQLDRGRN
jgi:MFS family permease